MPAGQRTQYSRRAWLAAASGTAATGLVMTRFDAIKAGAQEVAAPQVDPTKVPGRFVSEVGRRATGEQPRRLVRTLALSSSSRTPRKTSSAVGWVSVPDRNRCTAPRCSVKRCPWLSSARLRRSGTTGWEYGAISGIPRLRGPVRRVAVER